MARARKTAIRSKPVRRRAKLFWTGRSQAVRLPQEFRFAGREVEVHRDGERVVLEPVRVPRDERGWPLALWKLMGSAPDFETGERDERYERKDPFRPGR
jgi:virulence-associated protein VagC